MRKSGSSILLASALIASMAGCRCTCDSALGHYDWSLGKSHAADDCPPPAVVCAQPKCSAGPRSRLMTPPPNVSIDAPASSELVPLPTRPVFGPRMDGRQAGVIEPASADEPAAEPIPTPPPSAATSGTSLKLRRSNPPMRAPQ